ncbi:DUF5671 domain-containing protein [Dokdonella sp.]|uniref:DUF5671 domain-containing protein n=1 Tax=Dokdonella sp. TaxID=2291710 RepID=UPI003C4EBD4B
MASSSAELEVFIREALLRGASRSSVRQTLLDAGWATEQIQNALDAYADLEFVVPVPRPRPQLSAREAFLYLVLFTALFLSAYHLGSLLFDLINRAWPDPAMNRSWRSPDESIRWSIASILIAFPVFLFVARHLNRELTRSPVKRLSAIRRWLTYLTLFVAAGFLIGDLITLVFNTLGGELTIRFILKVIVAGLISGAIFGYYLWDLRQDERET